MISGVDLTTYFGRCGMWHCSCDGTYAMSEWDWRGGGSKSGNMDFFAPPRNKLKKFENKPTFRTVYLDSIA